MGDPPDAARLARRLHRAQEADGPLRLPACQGNACQTGDGTHDDARNADLLRCLDAIGK
jgi:hypothetical protein